MTAQSKRSKYAEKVATHNQMYGPGCCAHKTSFDDIDKAKQAAYDRGHFRNKREAELEQEET